MKNSTSNIENTSHQKQDHWTATQSPAFSQDQSGSSQSGSSPRHAAKKSSRNSSKRRNAYSYRPSLWSRLSAPILQCRRCGERYRASWTTDIRCAKCGRRPLKIQPWESILYLLFFPAALIGAWVHYGRSPRSAAIIIGLGLLGLLVGAFLYNFVL